MFLIPATTRRSAAVRSPHERLVRVHPRMNDLCCRLSVRCPMHLVLHRGKELLGHLGVRRVVHARGVDIEDLLVETPFGGPDVSNARQLLVEVVLLALAWLIFQPLVVHGEALHQILAQARRGLDLSQFRGRTVRIEFVGREDNGSVTSFVIDDVSIIVE